MTPILTLLSTPPYLDPLNSILGWLGWLVLLGAIVATVVRFREMQKHAKPRATLLILFILLAPIANLFFGVRLTSGVALPEPGIPSGPHNPALMAFSILPWMLAGGFLGPLDALIVAALSGLTRSLWDTQ